MKQTPNLEFLLYPRKQIPQQLCSGMCGGNPEPLEFYLIQF